MTNDVYHQHEYRLRNSGSKKQRINKTKEATGEDYAKWFFQNADFGPSSGDVRLSMEEQFERETGKSVPPDWRYG
jgi:hypothetical protein|tara:strand:+ start:340 stop:564 length:225 start_codon:yes stop_codon:yes gene_type:complete